MSNIKQWLIYSSIALAAILLVVMVFVFAPHAAVKECKTMKITIVNDNYNFVNAQKIEKYLRSHNVNPENLPFDDINLNDIEQLLKHNGAVAKAACYFTPQGTLQIDVTQREPLFRVLTPAENYYVDKERTIMPIFSGASANVLVVTGYIKKDYALNEIYDLVKFITEKNDYAPHFTQINISKEGVIELVPRVGDYIVILGDTENMDKKLAKWLRFIKLLPKYKSWDEYATIDLRFKNQVVCKKR